MSKIAFSTMFPDVAPPPLLREKLGGALLSGADISRDLSVLKLQMEIHRLILWNREGERQRGEQPGTKSQVSPDPQNLPAPTCSSTG